MIPNPKEKPTLRAPELAALLGVSVDSIYQAARDGDLPVPVLRLGRRLLFPTRPTLEVLGLAGEAGHG